MNKTSKRISKTKAQAKNSSAGKRAKTQLKTSKRIESTPPTHARISSLEIGDIESYLRLRQVLDSFHAVAIYYYASGENAQVRTERQKKVKQHLDSFLDEALDEETVGITCPPGTRQCPGGDCIPIFQVCLP
jgi:hypothetical protein